MISERLKKRLDPNRPMTEITMRLPVDVIEDMDVIAKARGFIDYRTLLKMYVSEGLREDEDPPKRAIVEIAPRGSFFDRAREQLASAQSGKAADYRLVFESRKTLLSELIRGSGNVSHDCGVPNTELRRFKAILAAAIIRRLNRRGISDRKAQTLTKIDASVFARVRDADFRRISVERLIAMLNGLGLSVAALFQPKPADIGPGKLVLRKHAVGRAAKATPASRCRDAKTPKNPGAQR
jgi:predicted XRE-type DNA-binding protein